MSVIDQIALPHHQVPIRIEDGVQIARTNGIVEARHLVIARIDDLIPVAYQCVSIGVH